MCDKTMTFSVNDEKENELKRNLTIIYDALIQKGYNPINQIVGYILSEDPTYITTYNNARSLIRHIDRDELLQVLVKSYLDEWFRKRTKAGWAQSAGFCFAFFKKQNKNIISFWEKPSKNFFAFNKSKVNYVHFFVRTKKRTKEMHRLKRRRTAYAA